MKVASGTKRALPGYTAVRMALQFDDVDMDTIAAALNEFRQPTREECRQFIYAAVEEKLERTRATQNLS